MTFYISILINNISYVFFERTKMMLFRRGREMLLTLVISRKMIFVENLSFARVAGGGIDGCVVGSKVGRCAWEAVNSADSPRSKSSSAASTFVEIGFGAQ
jgi:hypothetical protein